MVSASENCDTILRRVGLIDRFDARVTGREATAWQLGGKPAPDTFLKAAELLGTPAARAVVLEDAISGVQAGRTGGFGLVVGVDRGGAGEALAAAGADVVVRDLRALLDHGSEPLAGATGGRRAEGLRPDPGRTALDGCPSPAQTRSG